MQQLLEYAKEAASCAASLLKQDFISNAGVLSDSAKDLKTLADQAAQEAIYRKLSTSGIPILGEEDVEKYGGTDQRWIVDPLDGTVNFFRGFPIAGVSIGLWEGDNPILGVIKNIYTGDLFEGVVDAGAFLNGKTIAVSGVSKANQAILATGFPSGRNYDTESLLPFVKQVQQFKKVRMLGSAALMLAEVCAGHFDVYKEDDIYIWDVAAGLAIIKAAGGDYIMNSGSGDFKYEITAGNSQLINELKNGKSI